jgi:hypothetical protein
MLYEWHHRVVFALCSSHLFRLQLLCKAIVAVFNYLLLATFFWKLVEGLYIHTIIVWTFSATSLRLWYYALIGWGKSRDV